VNTISLGTITYEIWGWSNSDGTRTRHYFARSGFENPSAPNIPDIEVLLPSGDTLPCITDVDTVLATLQVLQESMPPNTGPSGRAGLRPKIAAPPPAILANPPAAVPSGRISHSGMPLIGVVEEVVGTVVQQVGAPE
jgi:hypothetical protein